MKKPNIRQFISPGKFLKKQFDYLKSKKRYKSVRYVAAILGFKSRVSLYDVFNDRFYGILKDIEFVKDVFELTKHEKEYLILLVYLKNSTTDFERNIFKREIEKKKLLRKF